MGEAGACPDFLGAEEIEHFGEDYRVELPFRPVARHLGGD